MEALNHEVAVANDSIRETVKEATRFAHLPAATQDQVRHYMRSEGFSNAEPAHAGGYKYLTVQ